MTTVAYRDGVMACDSCWTSDEAQTVSATKVRRLKHGLLWGASGDNDIREIVRLIDGCKTPASLPLRSALTAVRADCSGLVVFPNGKIFQIATAAKADSEGDVGVWEVNRGFAAVGTGGHLALGAMAAGRSAAQAVAIACRFDINSRPPIHKISLR